MSGNGVSVLNSVNNYNNSIGNQMAVKWDPKNLEIKTHSVEKTLEPLVMQVLTQFVLLSIFRLIETI